MPVYVVTGKLGAGKSLAAVDRIQRYLFEGRKVATNLNLFPEHLVSTWNKTAEIYRVPNKPTIEDLESLPLGHDEQGPNDSRNGALVLDECGTWFNSRTWNDKGRAALLDWCRHARKKRWDIYFIIQDVNVMDSQARDSFAEHVVYCRRLDRLPIPIISMIERFPLPKFHMAIVRYGDRENSLIVDRWFYTGKSLYNAYDTEQQFSSNDEIQAVCRVLPPHYTHGRYTSRLEKFKHDLKNKDFGKRYFFLAGAFVATFAVNALVTFEPELPKKGLFTCNETYEKIYGSCSADPIPSLEYFQSQIQQQPTAVDTSSKAPSSSTSSEPPFYFSAVLIAGREIQYYWVDADNNPIDIGPYKVLSHSKECTLRVRVSGGVEHDIGCLPLDKRYDNKDVVALKDLK
jgi:hypothetical protein